MLSVWKLSSCVSAASSTARTSRWDYLPAAYWEQILSQDLRPGICLSVSPGVIGTCGHVWLLQGCSDSLSISPAPRGSFSSHCEPWKADSHGLYKQIPFQLVSSEGGARRSWEREGRRLQEQHQCLGMLFLSGRWSWAPVRLAAGYCSPSWVLGVLPFPGSGSAPSSDLSRTHSVS